MFEKEVNFGKKEIKNKKRNFCLDLRYSFIFDMIILFMVVNFISKCIFVSMVMINWKVLIYVIYYMIE